MLIKKTDHKWCVLTSTGLDLRTKSFSQEDCENLLRLLAGHEDTISWLIGDCLLAGELKGYLNRGLLDEAAEITGRSKQRLMNIVSVCRAFESSRRREELSFAHHEEVAGHEHADQLLAWASDHQSSRNQLRLEVKRRSDSVKQTLEIPQQPVQPVAGTIDKSLAKEAVVTDVPDDLESDEPDVLYSLVRIDENQLVTQPREPETVEQTTETMLPACAASKQLALPAPAAPVMTEEQIMTEIYRLAKGLSNEGLSKIRAVIDRLDDSRNASTKVPVHEVSTEVPPEDGLISFDPLDMKLPKKFEDARFREAWGRWCRHNAKSGQPLDEIVASAQLKLLNQRNVEGAIAAIDTAIAGRMTTIPKTKDSRVAFIPPTLEQVAAFIQENQLNNVSAEKFVTHYGANGWKVGQSKMANWQMAVRSWDARAKSGGQSLGGSQAETKPSNDPPPASVPRKPKLGVGAK